MTSARKIAVAVLLVAFITGCRHKTNPAPPVAAQAPPIPLSTLANSAPPPYMPTPPLRKVNPPETGNTIAETQPKPHKPARRKPKQHVVEADQPPAKDQPAAPAAESTEQTANAGSGISPIGQLSAAGESTNTPRRSEILDEINSTENGLNNIKRPLDKDEQTTSTQIKTFLTKAREALNQEDLDGAHTLVTKAKVLLTELTK